MPGPLYASIGAQTSSISAATLTPALPATTYNGGALLCAVYSKNNAVHSTATAGWTKIDQQNSGASFTVSLFAALKGASAPVITWTGAAPCSSQIIHYADPASPVSATVGALTANTGSTGTHTTSSVNTTSANCLMVYVDVAAGNTSVGTPSGWTEDADAGAGSPSGRFAFGSKQVATSGTASGAISVSGASAEWVQWQVEIKQLAAGPLDVSKVEEGVWYEPVPNTLSLAKIEEGAWYEPAVNAVSVSKVEEGLWLIPNDNALKFSKIEQGLWLVADTTPPITGAQDVTLTLTSAATAAHGVSGDASSGLSLAHAATGAQGIIGQALATLGLTSTALGSHGVSGIGASALTLQQSASGQALAAVVSGASAVVLALRSAAAGLFYRRITRTDRAVPVMTKTRTVAVSFRQPKKARTASAIVVPPAPADTTPDAFNFLNVSDAERGLQFVSNIVTVSGLGAAAPISVSGGQYSKNSGSYTSSPGTVNNGDTVRVRVTASSSYSTPVSATVTIGGVSDTFTVTTEASVPDYTPAAFGFLDVIGEPRSSVVESNTIIVSGINAATPMSIVGGQYSKNGGAWSSAGTTVVNGDGVKVRLTTSASYATPTDATLTIGGMSDTFTVTTESAPAPSSYPPAVAARGALAEAVYDLRTTAGRTAATTKTIGVDTLPVGVTYDPVTNSVGVHTDATFLRWDTNEATFDIWGDFDVVFEQCQVWTTPRNRGFTFNCQNTGAPTNGLSLTFRRCTLDGSSAQPSTDRDTGPAAAVVYAFNDAYVMNMLVEDCAMLNIAANTFNWSLAGCNLTVRRCYETTPGTKAWADPLDTAYNTHCENHSVFGGTFTAEDLLIDCDADDELGVLGTQTGLLLFQARDNDIVVNLKRAILLPRSSPMGYLAQMGRENGHSLVLNAEQLIIQPGIFGYFGEGADPATHATKNLTNLVDFDSGLAVLGTTAAAWTA